MNSPGFKNRLTRRELLNGIRPKKEGFPVLNKKRCTGCGLCAIDCSTRALNMLRIDEEGLYRLVFRRNLCNSCGICEKSCPEHCLHLDKDLEPARIKNGVMVVFEDKMLRCSECGIPLFPQVMAHRLRTKVSDTGNFSWPFDLCPSCRVRTQFEKERNGKTIR